MLVPDFFVIGAYRCGTTGLYRSLREHPGVFLPLLKEPNFFAVDGNPSAGAGLLQRSVTSAEEYGALYADGRPGQRRGDISPEYLRSEWAVRRLAEVAPHAPLVAILRDPVQRAWSDFLMHVRDGKETCRTLSEVVEQSPSPESGRAGEYLVSGRYGEQIERYLSHFPREQLQVHLFDDLQADRQAVLSSMYAHIGVDPSFVASEEAAVNASGIPDSAVLAWVLRSRGRLRPFVNRAWLERLRPVWERYLSTRLERPDLPAADRALLCDYYRDDVARLQDLLGRDLSNWLRT